MSCARVFPVALMLAGALSTEGEATAKLLGRLDSVKEALFSPAGPPLTQSDTTTSIAQLPNGASSISETYGSWIVDCRLANGQKQCRLLQIQTNSQTSQRVFEIELQVPRDGKMDGTILMPFGLRLDLGAVVKLDDNVLGDGLRFFTCVPAGCLLPVSFSPFAVNAMIKGKMLTVASLYLNDAVVTFNIPLDGFSAATARVAELAAWKLSNS
jgi:invasion protein IalB